jgi:transaldolase
MNSSGIFFDSADLTEFKKWFQAHVLGGATTNPVILQKEGIFDIPTHVAKMIDICGKNFPISIEIPDTDMTVKEMLELGKRYYARFPDNAVVKVPMHPSNPEKAFEVIYKLGQEGIRVNATLGLSVGQLIGAAEADLPHIRHTGGAACRIRKQRCSMLVYSPTSANAVRLFRRMTFGLQHLPCRMACHCLASISTSSK